ncbi:MAG TPA: hypothetical protein VF103_10765, partial [Polyangiaceae bacterium]
MGRRHHLEKVYVQNLERASSTDGVEFVLLDYGSRDGLADWVERELGDWRARGILRYFKTD